MRKGLQSAILFFESTEPRLAELLKEIDEKAWFGDIETDSNKLFSDLCRTIIGQQLAGKAAEAIWKRFAEFLKGDVCPATVLKHTDQEYRNLGLSWAKARSILDLASKVSSDEVVLYKLFELENEQVIVELVKVKGIGRWTAEMFLMFRLGREDIFSMGDLGIKNGLKKFLGKEDVTTDEILEVTGKWSPYRSYSCVAMWHLLDNR